MSTSQGSIATGQGSRVEQSRRSWTKREEEALIASMKELLAEGKWKSDNGFKPGFYGALENMIRIAVPGTTLKKDPHINSKITTWKKNYASLTTILSRSGVGFNLNGDHMVDCDLETKKELILGDKNAKTVLNNPQTFYEDWKILFGNDRATGEKVQDVMEAVNEIYNEERDAENHGPAVNDKTDVGGETHEASECQSSDRANKDSKRRKKCAIDEGMQTMCDLLSQIHRDTNERLERLSTRIGYKADLGKARKEVFDIVTEIPGLTLDDQLVVGETLAENEKRLEFFMGLPLAARATYVQKMITPKD